MFLCMYGDPFMHLAEILRQLMRYDNLNAFELIRAKLNIHITQVNILIAFEFHIPNR